MKKSKNNRNFDDAILLVVHALIFGHPLRALIDSGAARCFISTLAVVPLGLSIIHDYTFLELGDGQEILSKGKVIDIHIVIASVMARMNLTITSLLYEAGVILVIN